MANRRSTSPVTEPTTIPTKIRVGQNVRRLRIKRGHTLKQLAEVLAQQSQPIGIGTLSKIELGDREITVAHLEALASALGVTADKLLAHADMDALVRVQNLILHMASADHAIFEAEQTRFDLQSQIQDRRAQLASLGKQLADELAENRDLIEQLTGEGVTRALEIAEAISSGTPPMEAARYLR